MNRTSSPSPSGVALYPPPPLSAFLSLHFFYPSETCGAHYSLVSGSSPSDALDNYGRQQITRALQASGFRMITKQLELDYPRSVNDEREFEEAGAVYMFRRINAVYSGLGDQVSAPDWPPMEQMKIVPPGLSARDAFGRSIALDDTTLFVGANGDDAYHANAGAAYQYDVDIQRVYFRSAEFTCTEGDDTYCTVIMDRDPDYADRALTVAYATSDLTAKGVDTGKFNDCWNSNIRNREGCGDYLQTAGEVTFSAGSTSELFTVFLMNDRCWEHYPEYIQVTLSPPGGVAAIGEDYVAKIRIDDDDFTYTACTHELL